MSIVILGVIGFIGLAAFKGVDGVLGIFGSLTGLLSLQSTSTVVGGFPNVLISVAELGSAKYAWSRYGFIFAC